MSALERAMRRALGEGLRFVMAGQGRDGFWRDYALPPGPSDVWATAWIGWCVGACRARLPQGAGQALAGAARAVRAALGPEGWGYNRATGADADSTAWACRFLTASGAPPGDGPWRALAPFLDPAGAAHSFREPGLGRWGEAHAEVTPIVGLALVEAGGAAAASVARIRARVIADQAADGSWAGYWWASDVYASAWSLVFLAATGGIPPATAARAGPALRAATGRTALEQALALLAWTRLNPAVPDTLEVLDVTLAAQRRDGAWPPSALLRVPERFPAAGQAAGPPHADGQALMTTALTCAALSATLSALRGLQGRGAAGWAHPDDN